MKMVVTDLDGTLLKNDKTISAFTSDMIDKLREKGILFAIATARPIRAVKEFLPFLKYDIGIYHNGAVIIDDSQKIANFGIENPQKVVWEKENPNYNIAVEVNDSLYSNFDAGKIWSGIFYIPTTDFHEIKDAIADKIIIETNSQEQIDAIGNMLPENLYIQLCENIIALIMNKKATKMEAIKAISHQKEISLDKVVAFGDDYNDVEMIRGCGIGVAMENALDAVKKEADVICASNEADGVARWLEEHL